MGKVSVIISLFVCTSRIMCDHLLYVEYLRQFTYFVCKRITLREFIEIGISGISPRDSDSEYRNDSDMKSTQKVPFTYAKKLSLTILLLKGAVERNR